MKEMVKTKRGLSPVIASVLLIALVLVLASIIFLWARGFVSEQIEKFGQPVDAICDDVAFDVEKVQEVASLKLEIVNRGNVDIYSFDIKGYDNKGNSWIQNFPLLKVDVGKASNEIVKFEGSPEKIIIYPALLGNVKGKSINKVFTCTEQGKTIIL